jgi:hypothetical protein
MNRLFPGPAPLRGDGTDLDPAERARLRAAALHARRVYPGDLGVLASREITALAEFGMRFDHDALIPRLATAILAVPAQPDAGEGRPGEADGPSRSWAAGAGPGRT